MNKKTLIILLTAAGFATGLGSGLWMSKVREPATPPPSWVFSELKSTTRPGSSLQNVVQSRPDLWREINQELRTLRPQIEEFRERLREIDDDFRREFEAMLTEPQRRKLAELQKKRELPRIHSTPPPKEPAPKPAAAPKPEPAKPVQSAQPERPPRMYQESADGLVAAMIFVPYTRERFTQALGLDAEQDTRLRELLLLRRDRFLRLADETPPPSLQLNRIADIVRKAEQAEAGANEGGK